VVVEAGDGVAEADGVPAARLADSWRMRRSPQEQGRPPLARAVMAASQSMAAIGVLPLVPQVMNLLVKSSRCRKVPLQGAPQGDVDDGGDPLVEVAVDGLS
jgi:hypothetical protein